MHAHTKGQEMSMSSNSSSVIIFYVLNLGEENEVFFFISLNLKYYYWELKIFERILSSEL
jgi:hypothetical protein